MAMLVLTLGILFVSALANTTFGFGYQLLAISLLSLFFDVQQAAPLVVSTTFIIAFLIVVREWKLIDRQSVVRLLVSAVLGIPLGLWVLMNIPEIFLSKGLGALLISYGLFRILSKLKLERVPTSWAYLFGFLGGVLGSACGMTGPPVIVYGSLKQWNPKEFRASFQAFLLLASTLIALGHGFSGLWTLELGRQILIALPLLILSVFIGNWLNKLLPANKFDRIIFFAFIVLGVLLWLK